MPISPSSVCPCHSPALGVLFMIFFGIFKTLAISLTSHLYRAPIGSMSTPP